MATILIILGILCLGYYLFLRFLQMDFALIWLLAALMLLLFGGGQLYLHDRGITLPIALVWSVGIVAAVGIGVFVVIEGLIISRMTQKLTEEPEYIIVLGAQVKGDHPSIALQKRIDTAEAYLKEHPDVHAILSGGQGLGEDMSEAWCMADALMAEGISADRLILEDTSTTTRENLMNSAHLVPDLKDKRVALVTQNFHVYRSLKLAQHQGYTHVSGIPAPSVWLYQPHFMVREAFALVKEKLVGNI